MKLNARSVRSQLRGKGVEEDGIEAVLTLYDRRRFAKLLVTDHRGRGWKARRYQVESLESCADRKVHCDGRDVGKTSEIEIMAVWAMLARPHTEMLIATQCENHLFPLMHRLVRRFESSPILSKSLLEVKRSPSWFLRFENGFVLWGRIAGPRGMNFQGLHVDWQIVDEAQEMTDTAWGELYQALNGDGWRWVYGVPNGLRNTFYRMTRMQDVEQYNWPSALNPDFTKAKDRELVQLYGGKRSPGYVNRVLGQHGSPAHGVFDLDDYLACVDDGVVFSDLEVGEEDDFSAPGDVVRGDYYLGCDLGFARDPSEFMVYRAEEPHFVNVLRVHLEGVNYAKQQRIIMALDNAYDFRRIGIDCGNSGRAVAHNLMAEGPEWCDKVMAFEFGSTLELEPLPDGGANRRPMKPFMTELLERRMAEGSLVFPRLAAREAQYASHTYTVGQTGTIVYDKGNDHIIDADRCAVLARFLDTMDVGGIELGVRVAGF